MKSVKKAMRLAAIPGMIMLGLATSVNAQTITIESDTGQRNSVVAITVDFEPGDTAVAGYNTIFSYDDSILSADPTVTAGVGACTVDPATSTISVIRATFPATELGAAEVICTVNFPIDGAAPFGVYPLEHDPSDIATGFSDLGGNAVDGEVVNGQIEVTDAPPNVTLSYAPAPGPVVFDGGTQNDVVNESITVTAGGTSGSGSVTDCAITGPNAGAFAVTSGDLSIAAGANDTIDLTATLDDAPISATLTCLETDSDSTDTPRVWQLSAPAGSPVPSPGYASSPVAGTELTCNGAPGDVAETSITITNDGNPGVGSDLTFNCTVSGAGFSIAGAAGDSLAVGESTQVTVECTVPAEDAPAIEGNLNCTSNDPGAASNDYPLSSIAETALPPITQPNVVPASSLWSQLSLIGLMAALGLLVVGIRRKG